MPLRSILKLIKPIPLLIILAAGFALVVFGHDQKWLRERAWSVDNLGGGSVLLGPVLAGYGYVIAAMDGRRGRLDYYRATARGTTFHLAAMTLAIGALAIVMECVALGVVAVQLRLHGLGLPSVTTIIYALTPCALALVAYPAVGVRLGGRLRLPALAPVIAVGVLVVTDILGVYTPGVALVTFGGATVSLVGLAYRPTAIGLQALWCTAVAGFSIFRKAPSIVAGVAAVCCAIALTGLGLTRFAPAHADLVCQGTAPKVCVAADYRDRLSTAMPYARRINRVLSKINDGIVPHVWSQDPASHSTAHLRLPDGHVSPTGMAVSATQWLSTCGPPHGDQQAIWNAIQLRAAIFVVIGHSVAPKSPQVDDSEAPDWYMNSSQAARIKWAAKVGVPAWKRCDFHTPMKPLDGGH